MADIWLPDRLKNEMIALATASWPLETGGMFVGYAVESGDVVITEIIGPGPSANHQRSMFEPDAIYQEAMLEQYFTASEGKETYLGDWHTHPDYSNKMSALDKDTLRRIAASPESGTANPVMAIFGGPLSDLALKVVRYRREKWFTFFSTEYLEILEVRTY